MTYHSSGENEAIELRICPVCRAVQAKGWSCDHCGKALTLVTADHITGWQLGKYRLERVLGAGGMGMVYQASHITLNKTVALKILLPRTESDSEDFGRRFLREARVLAEIHHPNIIEIYDMDITEWGAPYFVMEYVKGLSLDTFLDRHKGPIPESWVAEITEGLVSGLAFAHSKGIVHRDLKPENIYLSLYGKAIVPKILDFGIAKLVSEHENATRLTSTGAVVGTPEYLTPEQVLNHELGGWTDQYTLSLVVAEMLTGKRPRAGKSLLEIVSTEIHRPLDLVSMGIPMEKSFAPALFRATQPDPEKRFKSVESFLGALRLEHDDGTVNEMIEWVASIVSEDEERTGMKDSTDKEIENILSSGSHPSVDVNDPTRRVIPANRQKLPLKKNPRRYPFNWVIWGTGALLMSIMLIVSWKLSQMPEKTAFAGESYPLVKRTAQWDLPPDTTAILGQSEKEILIKGAGGVYLLNNNTGKFAKFPFPEQSVFLCGDSYLGVFLLKNRSVLHWNPKEGHTEIIESHLPALGENEKILSGRINLENTRLLYSTNQRIRLISLEKGKTRVLYTHKAAGSKILFAMGREMAAITLPNRKVCVLRLKNGEIVATFNVNELRLYSLAISEPMHLVALGGWFDKIYLLDYLHPDDSDTVPQKGESYSVIWLSNGTDLVAGGIYGGLIWNRETGFIRKIPIEQSGKLVQIFRGDGVILTLDETLKLSTFHFNRISKGIRHRLGNNSIWTMGNGPSNHIFAGDSRGTLYEFDKSGVLKTHPLHTLGIGALVSDGKFLATASDDKTIAVWKLPQMQVEWRSRAHNFLVNGIWLTGKSLWSVSSDGDIKEWGWPDLAPGLVIRVSDMLKNRRTSCQCVWSDPKGQRVLVGTWDMGIIALEKKGGNYNWTHHRTIAKVIYQAARIPGMELIAFSTLNPNTAYVYDLQKNKLYKLPVFRASVMALCAGRNHEIWYYGPGSIMQYRFTRGKDGIVHFSASGGMESAMDIGISGCLASDMQHLVIGNENGEVFWWNIAQLEKQLAPAVQGTLKEAIPVADSGTVSVRSDSR
ncbi:MAG: protein kinase [Acidobacteria bacterium]|nr:protein kinase [Acidobacteriota bacterium]